LNGVVSSIGKWRKVADSGVSTMGEWRKVVDNGISAMGKMVKGC
jgi:hypothetical protein